MAAFPAEGPSLTAFEALFISTLMEDRLIHGRMKEIIQEASNTQV